MSSIQDLGLAEDQIEPLNHRQKNVYVSRLSQFTEYLQKKGKEPKKKIGYADKSVSVKISRFHQLVRYVWSNESTGTQFTTDHGDTVNAALADDSFRRKDGGRYSEGSKRKFNDALRNWFEFQGEDWEPEITFSDERATNNADPFKKSELETLTEASLTYKSIPTYDNITPDERDRWKTHIAQELGKPKEEVVPADWDEINNCWKIPSLVRTTRECGWRPDLIGRIEVGWYDGENQTIDIPEGEAPKNDSAWSEPLTDEAAFMLEEWLSQRSNMEMYDGKKEIWLTRKGNPYSSGPLNDLLRNLMEEAGIKPHGRNLVWYSFRHSIGTYVYHEYTDLEIVSEKLRQNTRDAASRYVHPLPELKRDASKML